jgi:ATP-binding cassette subfamily B protein
MLFTPKLISKSFKVIEAFAKDKTVSKAVIHEELLSNILLVIANNYSLGF